MKPAEHFPHRICPQCGAPVAAGKVLCWLCNEPVPVAAEPGPPPHTGRFQFGLSTLLTVITLAAILLSIGVTSPGLGIVAAMLALPALVRTCVVAARRRSEGESLSASEKAGVFAATVVMVIGIVLASAGAFVVTFLATCMMGTQVGFGGYEFALRIGAYGAVAAALLVTLVFWLRPVAEQR
jgi:hypothetical protein